MYVDIANNALKKGWATFPTILDPEHGPILRIHELHSPLVLAQSPKESVPNSIRFDPENGRQVIITGPNAQGKSTLIRAVAQEIVATSLGSPVSAKEATQTPLTLVPYVHPTDKPDAGLSLFVAESQALKEQVLNRAQENPYSLVILDEIWPGTISEIRTNVESALLEELNELGVASITATHNWGTTSLGVAQSQFYQNLHVDKFKVLPGAASDLDLMYQGAADALKKAGWSDGFVDKVMRRAKKNPLPSSGKPKNSQAMP